MADAAYCYSENDFPFKYPKNMDDWSAGAAGLLSQLRMNKVVW
jgi:hypothetical protein